MKRLIYITLLISLFTLTSCSNKTTQELKEEAINNIETNLKNSEENYLNQIPTAPNDSNQKEDINKDGVIDFKDNFNNNLSDSLEDTSNKEEINSQTQNQEQVSTTKPNNLNENNNPSNQNKEQINTNLQITNKFINPKDYNFSSYINNETFQNLQLEVSNLNKHSKLLIKDNCISYNNSANGPSIELYKTDDYYAIYLYCVLDETATTKENLEQIKMNQKILINLLNTITSTPKEIYESIYNDYELDSTISEKKYTKIGDCNIKSEIMQRYVIYYLK